MWGNFSLKVSFMSFFRSDGLTYSITVVCERTTVRVTVNTEDLHVTKIFSSKKELVYKQYFPMVSNDVSWIGYFYSHLKSHR